MPKIKILLFVFSFVLFFNACSSAPQKDNCANLKDSYLVYFDFNSAAINVKGFDTLKHAAAAAACCGKTIEINGHSDIKGTEAYNELISLQRAQSATDFLISLGVNPSLIKTMGYGYTRPYIEGEDDEANAKNRRAEILLK